MNIDKRDSEIARGIVDETDAYAKTEESDYIVDPVDFLIHKIEIALSIARRVSKSPLYKQERWRQKKRLEGKCTQCGRKRDGVSVSFCNKCLEKARKRYHAKKARTKTG